MKLRYKEYSFLKESVLEATLDVLPKQGRETFHRVQHSQGGEALDQHILYTHVHAHELINKIGILFKLLHIPALFCLFRVSCNFFNAILQLHYKKIRICVLYEHVSNSWSNRKLSHSFVAVKVIWGCFQNPFHNMIHNLLPGSTKRYHARLYQVPDRHWNAQTKIFDLSGKLLPPWIYIFHALHVLFASFLFSSVFLVKQKIIHIWIRVLA